MWSVGYRLPVSIGMVGKPSPGRQQVIQFLGHVTGDRQRMQESVGSGMASALQVRAAPNHRRSNSKVGQAFLMVHKWSVLVGVG